jgi:hypothetical protein
MEAIELENRTRQNARWNFNDEVFSTVNWQQEPANDLWSMYKSRARQIRNQYDYIVLFYSGGSDSHNILNAWIDADCKIDEIAAIWNYGASSDKQDHCNAEITNVVLPDIETLRNRGLEFEFRLIDISQYSLDIFNAFGTNFEYYINRYFSINNPARALFREKIEDYKNIIDSGKKLCFLWGVEKPVIEYDGRYYFNFIDALDNCVSPYVQERYNRGWFDELFYWSPDAPLIPIKQAHIVKNFLQLCNDKSFYQNEYTSFGYNKTLKQYLRAESVKNLIYPKWSNDIFCNGKAGSFIYSDRDKWFFKSNLDLKERFDQIVKNVVNHGRIKNKNIVPHYSQRYYLE